MKALTIQHWMVPFPVGVLTAMVMQGAGGWWLNSGRGVATMMAVLFGLAVIVSLRSEAPWHRAVALSIGSVVGMTATLWWTGPGTLWPIVLVMGGALTIAAVFAGAGLAYLIRRRL